MGSRKRRSSSRLAGGSSAEGKPMEDGFSSQLLSVLLQRERRLLQDLPQRMPQGDDVIGWRERNREASWTCSAARRLGLGLDSSALAVALLDRVVLNTRVPSKYINCVAAASLSIAKKICEDHDEDSYVFLGRLRLEYSASELKRMELRILSLLDWDAHLPTVYRFVESFLCQIGAAFFLDLIRPHVEALLCESLLTAKFRPSVLALSLVSILLESSNRQYQQTTNAMAKSCKIDMFELNRCRGKLLSLWTRLLLPKLTPFELLAPQLEEGLDAKGEQFRCLAPTPTGQCPAPTSTPDLASPRPLQPTPC
ncbi:unnamed protein product [Caenorhabditis auriculariae]|uniref:Cyclin-like domain-containing protein n=1 Tax=Caenorhabditis auriculariae TaxID=2777116 RepID=A0A8S1HLD8_9PELO|nr:unnamed protein product [Caenorhabditis auriculariae]